MPSNPKIKFRCPKCNSAEIRYRALFGNAICKRCGKIFEIPQDE